MEYANTEAFRLLENSTVDNRDSTGQICARKSNLGVRSVKTKDDSHKKCRSSSCQHPQQLPHGTCIYRLSLPGEVEGGH